MKLHLTLPSMDSNPYLVFPESVGRYNEMPDHRTERQSDFPYFNFHYVASGQGFVEVEGQWQLVQPGDAFFYFPHQSQQYRSSEENPWDVYWMHFYGDRISEHLTELGFRRSVVWSTNRNEGLKQRMGNLIQEIDNHKLLRPSTLSMLTYGVIAEFMAQAVPHRSSRNQETLREITDLLPAMQDAASKPFSLDVWAAKAGISTYYFCKMFRKATQLSPMDFITLCRIRLAKQLLLDDPASSVEFVAQTCGYDSVSYFIKRFKDKEGVTPTVYRRLHA
ncbi:helix-turn-helix domain-containing protein [Cohnella lupini]|uniref:AraC-like DNA-binding protein n=1 Tax=Cohnella lupini TaxID=1294267 RepID=A0A3D9IA78_9BACL|nr:AraC family transcriptional regulator [Cohnella lupini]RED58627.1 AraC-like DNA-binding protein [Cohnella lupini]